MAAAYYGGGGDGGGRWQRAPAGGGRRGGRGWGGGSGWGWGRGGGAGAGGKPWKKKQAKVPTNVVLVERDVGDEWRNKHDLYDLGKKYGFVKAAHRIDAAPHVGRIVFKDVEEAERAAHEMKQHEIGQNGIKKVRVKLEDAPNEAPQGGAAPPHANGAAGGAVDLDELCRRFGRVARKAAADKGYDMATVPKIYRSMFEVKPEYPPDMPLKAVLQEAYKRGLLLCVPVGKSFRVYPPGGGPPAGAQPHSPASSTHASPSPSPSPSPLPGEKELQQKKKKGAPGPVPGFGSAAAGADAAAGGGDDGQDGADGEPKRIRSDGLFYTKAEFIRAYGKAEGLKKWAWAGGETPGSPLPPPPPIDRGELSAEVGKLATELANLWRDVAAGSADAHGDGDDSNEKALRKMAEGGRAEAVFPVYGAVKAGKSTFLSCIMRESILPAQALPMTSIPIKVTHATGSEKLLNLKQVAKWNKCVEAYRDKLVAGQLQHEIKGAAGGGDEAVLDKLRELQEAVRSKKVRFVETSRGERDIQRQLETLSHFVRLLWFNDIDFEGDHGISIDIDDLPEVFLDMKAFRDGPVQRFSFLDTPGPNEAKAKDALTKIGPKMMASSTGCIFCVPWDQVEADQTMPLYMHINNWMEGKTVVVILTKMDAHKGSDEERRGLGAKVRGYFNKNIRDNVRLHYTSGHLLLFLFDLQHLLHQHADSDDATFVSALKSNGKLYEKLIKEYVMLKHLKDDQLRTALQGTLDDELARYGAKEVLDDFRYLYTSAERLAARGQVNNLGNSFRLLGKKIEKLDELASASAAERERLLKRQQQIEDIYKSATRQLDTIVGNLNTTINQLLGAAFRDLKEWARTQDKWRIEVTDAPEGGAGGGGGAAAGGRDVQEFEQVLRIHGARTGKITCSLRWFNSDDLDLHCVTPDGSHIYYGQKRCGGGHLDVDKNRGTSGEDYDPVHPAENIYFERPAAGQYRFYVNNYSARNGDGTQTKYEVMLKRGGGQPEVKKFHGLAGGQDRDAFRFSWAGSGPGAGATADRIPFAGGKAELLMFLRDKAKPKFSRFMKTHFERIMLGGVVAGQQKAGALKGIKKAIDERWSELTGLLDKLREMGECDNEEQFIEFKRAPSIVLLSKAEATADLSNRVCDFDVNKITYIEESNQVVLVNAKFKADVLKLFNGAADDAARTIQDEIVSKLAVVIHKFKEQVAAEKAAARDILEQHKNSVEQSLSKQEIEAMLDKVRPKVAPLGDKIKRLLAKTDAPSS